MANVTQSIQQLPQQSWIPILILLVIGLAMWLAGRRLLRGAFAAIGLVLGAGAGWIVGELVALPVASSVVAVIGGLLLACVATLAYRAAVAAGLALVLALAAPLGVWAIAAGGPLPLGDAPMEPVAVAPDERPDEPEPDGPPSAEDLAIEKLLDQAREKLGLGDPDDGEEPVAGEGEEAPRFELSDEVRESLESAQALGKALVEQDRSVWARTPPNLREELIGAAVLGALIGFIIGTLATPLSAKLVTAFAGSLIVLTGAWSGIIKAGVSDNSWLPATPRGWLTLWVVLSVIGLAIQWMTRPKRADKAG